MKGDILRLEDILRLSRSRFRSSRFEQKTQLDEVGFEFVRSCISTLETRGIKEQGLYRNCGVTSKVQQLMRIGLDKRKSHGEKLNFGDASQWEIKTISSAIKTFLRNLPDSLITADLHNYFINAAKLYDERTRIEAIHYYVYQLPPKNRKMLEIIIYHLKNVADNCKDNLMTVGNLGVCFGPTLLRSKGDDLATIMDVKYYNIVVEVLIANYNKIFNSLPETIIDPVYSSFSDPVFSVKPRCRVKTLYACTADQDTELCFQPGQIITNVYESKEAGWLIGTLNGKTGLVPANYVERLP